MDDNYDKKIDKYGGKHELGTYDDYDWTKKVKPK